MPFIGNQPALSYTSFAKQDFSTSATTSYTLDNPVANANELALFINFVRQEPTTAYSASGTTLTLTSATSSSDDMYCVYLGKAVQTVNPPNASVGTSQLVDGSVTSAKLSAGKVLQVVQTVKDTKFSTTSTSFTDVTGLSASITPSSSSNKILITASFCTSNGSNSQINMFNLLRGSTAIGQPASSQTYTSTRTQYTYESGNMDTVHLQLLDSPSTTSATTYKIQGKCNGGTLVVGNRNDNDSEQISIITLMEVSA